MKKKTTGKLALKKATVTHLSQQVQAKINGGGPLSMMTACLACVIIDITRGDCDMPTIGHDDGSYCISKDRKAWCGGI
jgi:hypothetical protein